MSEFTPGPWESSEHGSRGLDGPICFRIRSESGIIADTLGYSARDDANARLIAAAPELLELAKRVQWLLAQRNYPGRERDEATILKEAEAAIQKAIGQAVPHA